MWERSLSLEPAVTHWQSLVAYQLNWFICVWGAARGWGWLGPLTVSLAAIWQLALSRQRLAELRLMVGAAVLGTAVESGFQVAGFTVYPGVGLAHWPFWMIALWVSFGATLAIGFRWLIQRPALGIVLGGLLGPPAYWAGRACGAVLLPRPSGLTTVVIGLTWAVALPALLLWARHCLAGKSQVQIMRGRRSSAE
ncbi:MAG: DUF2878 domain-containing protein [Candidatus Sericytochromatia bacterium]|nr:DUF2878 domain-containing protein [Candidatus Sericytochromatia bacterium]